jgi:OmpA-OmpF porin, OOP family
VAMATRIARPAEAASGATMPPPAAKAHAIYFGVNRASLTPDAQKTIHELATEAQESPDARIVVTGKADRTGNGAHNMRLSEERAEAVSRALQGAGVPADRIEAHGVGESEPTVPTADNVAEPKNRVADVVIH